MGRKDDVHSHMANKNLPDWELRPRLLTPGPELIPIHRGRRPAREGNSAERHQEGGPTAQGRRPQTR